MIVMVVGLEMQQEWALRFAGSTLLPPQPSSFDGVAMMERN